VLTGKCVVVKVLEHGMSTGYSGAVC